MPPCIFQKREGTLLVALNLIGAFACKNNDCAQNFFLLIFKPTSFDWFGAVLSIASPRFVLDA